MPVDICKQIILTDPVHGCVTCSAIEHAVLNRLEFNRLHHIRQGSLLYRTFPGSNVSRFEHSIGTMRLAGEYLFNAICNSDLQTVDRFIREVSKEIEKWAKHVADDGGASAQEQISEEELTYYKDCVFEAPLPNVPLYVGRTPANLLLPGDMLAVSDTVGGEQATDEGAMPGDAAAEDAWRRRQIWSYYAVFQAVRLAGMLHDVGHLPYSHVLENAMERLYNVATDDHADENGEWGPVYKSYRQAMDEYFANRPGHVAFHEQLGQKVCSDILRGALPEIESKNTDTKYGHFLGAVRYLTKGILKSREDENSIFSDLHRIVAGTLDVDRMDYCLRDVQATQGNRDTHAYGRMLASLRMQYAALDERDAHGQADTGGRKDGDERCLFCISTKGVEEAENLLQRRFDIFANLNYHHRVHRLEILMERVLALIGEEELRGDKDLPKEESGALPLQFASIWQLAPDIAKPISTGHLVLQLDDSWLDTVLNRAYFTRFGKKDKTRRSGRGSKRLADPHNDPIWNMFDELVTSTKRYHSLIKRADGFRSFDEEFYRHLVGMSDDSAEAKVILDAVQASVPLRADTSPNPANRVLPYDALRRAGCFSYPIVLRHLGISCRNSSSFYAELEDRMRTAIEPLGVIDCIIADSTFSLGISDESVAYVCDNGGAPRKLQEYSGIVENLRQNADHRPQFHFYYLPAWDAVYKEQKHVDRDALLDGLAQTAASLLCERQAAQSVTMDSAGCHELVRA